MLFDVKQLESWIELSRGVRELSTHLEYLLPDEIQGSRRVILEGVGTLGDAIPALVEERSQLLAEMEHLGTWLLRLERAFEKCPECGGPSGAADNERRLIHQRECPFGRVLASARRGP